MRRVLVRCWGADGNKYAGRRMTLYRDEGVQFGGIKVGGIRISHLSHIDGEITMALTATRAKRTPYTVKPLRADVVKKPPAASASTSTLPLSERAEAFLKRVAAAGTPEKIKAVWAASDGLRADLDAREPELLVEVTEAWERRRDEIEAAQEDPA
jgi:acetyl esterase/lipase